jgi:phosphopantothenoylcysteine decarboxylase/phosphopantothenate--cysteine ligase
VNKKIVVGVSGSIAAYKAVVLTRLLIKVGCQVKVIMTPTATKFVSALTFSTLSKNDVSIDFIQEDTWSNHVDLGLWADAFVVAPATATTLAKMANGIADNMLVATYLSAKCPVYIAPAMDLDMWKHGSTIQNLNTLTSYGNHIIPVGVGELASGLSGAGRMAEPADIVSYLAESLNTTQDLKDQTVLITAGPTQEAFDPVRFIGNHSSGRMGIELATECAARGAKVQLVLGPTSLSVDHPNIAVKSVVSAQDMYDATIDRFKSCDIAIFCAAVADYRPKEKAKDKIKKSTDSFTVELERTPDIAYTCGQIKSQQKTIGFALETTEGIEAAHKKIKKKNLDLIVLNSLKDKGAGFKHNTNKVSIVHTDGTVNEYELKSKRAVAQDVIDALLSLS